MIPDDTKLGFGGGADGTGTADSTIEYDEDGTDKIVVSGASWQFNCGIGITGGTTIDNIQIKLILLHLQVEMSCISTHFLMD